MLQIGYTCPAGSTLHMEAPPRFLLHVKELGGGVIVHVRVPARAVGSTACSILFDLTKSPGQPMAGVPELEVQGSIVSLPVPTDPNVCLNKDTSMAYGANEPTCEVAATLDIKAPARSLGWGLKSLNFSLWEHRAGWEHLPQLDSAWFSMSPPPGADEIVSISPSSGITFEGTIVGYSAESNKAQWLGAPGQHGLTYAERSKRYWAERSFDLVLLAMGAFLGVVLAFRSV